MNLRRPPLLLVLLMPLLALAPARAADDETDWQAVQALEAGPSVKEIRSREEARAVTLAHLARQETSLRAYLQAHATGSHALDARLRLARLYATRSDFSGKPEDFATALRILDEAFQTAPVERRADIDFSRIALSMRRVAGMQAPGGAECERLAAQAAAFQERYPGERRVGALFAEVATLFDAQPRRKEDLLRQALAAARTPELRARVEDDLHRLSLLGQPVAVRGVSVDGKAIDLGQYRGRVVLVYFFASWSAPAVAGLDTLEAMRKPFAGQPLEVVGVSLDSSRDALATLLRGRGITWPVAFEEKGWKSPLVRGLSINALPAFWVIDRRGVLRSLNARADGEELVRQLLAEKE
ncbi:MAG: TlpA disulfide reductase family protein [Chthoniobacteraceae bacterium]|nr:TlpA disulfide reductase family protein [Chthoniobacteraceae bacterium]